MKEHESRIAERGEIIFYGFSGEIDDEMEINSSKVYVDCNNFAHNLDGPAWGPLGYYFIHGKHYKNKQDWELEVNRIKTLEEL